MTSRKRFLALALAGATVAPASVGAETLTHIRVATTPVDSGGQVYYAQDMGFFKRAGFDVEISSINAGPVIAAGVAAGQYDFAQVNVASLASAHEKNIAFRMVAPAALYNETSVTSALVCLKSAPFKTAKDLNGKTIAVNALTGIQQIATQAWIEKNGGDVTSVKFIELSAGQMLSALNNAKLDVALITQPGLDNAEHDTNLRVLAPAFNGIANQFLVSAWMSATPYVQQHADVVKRFQSVMVETARWANAHQQQSGRILEAYTKLNVTPTMARIRYAEAFDPSDLQSVIDACAKFGLLKKSFPASELTT